ncbi:hypothetical protein S83_005022 [Arachis hypogaea]
MEWSRLLKNDSKLLLRTEEKTWNPSCVSARKRTQDLCQLGAKYWKKFGFEFFTTTNMRDSHRILAEVKARCENNILVELDIASKQEFIFIERKLTKLWEQLSEEKLQEDTDDIGEIVQDSLEEELLPSKSSDEVSSTGQKTCLRDYDLNKTPDENERL